MSGGYRDEREALRLRIQGLEGEVADLQQQLRTARAADMAATQRKLEEATGKIALLESNGGRRDYFFVGAGVGLFIGIGAGMWFAGFWGG